ncbi:putative carboxylesterase 120 [Raphanus sativus]|uniref:Probable carboxylesterase 120 n=1 Tax=Raphanus sativus TaxID=3726 RepID=A0A6J0JL54_RAPSA|nr:probable carboxylesterase 120 [Raphanus sativus]KAJ4887753.1 putative carboxylesterase 120 [Raphanus sativus]
MSEPSQASDRYTTPEPSPQIPVVSKDITVNLSKSKMMRLYVPTAAPNGGVSPKKLPLVVYYHCGGFTAGSIKLDLDHNLCNIMAWKLKAMVASASYRLAPEHRLPAAYLDGVDAVEWIKYSDDEWIKSYADLSNVYLMGTGSGGNLAYNAGIRAANLAPLRIRGLFLNQPLFGSEERCESEVNADPPSILNSVDAHWKLCLPVGANRDHEYSNPTVGDGPDIMEVMGQRGWKVVVSGVEGDPLVDRHRNVAKLMKEKGVDVVEHFTDGDVPNLIDLFASIRNVIHSSAP